MATPQRAKATSTTSKTRSIKSYLTPSQTPSQRTIRPSTTNSPSLEERIRQRAYDIYVRRGCSDGFDRFDWDVAETVVRLESAASRSGQARNRIGADATGLESDIQRKAFELFEKRGYAHGNDAFDWALAQEIVSLEKRT